MTQPLVPNDKLHDRITELTRENAKLRAENQRLGGATTMMGCKRCGNGVRPRYAVYGMCGDCARRWIAVVSSAVAFEISELITEEELAIKDDRSSDEAAALNRRERLEAALQGYDWRGDIARLKELETVAKALMPYMQEDGMEGETEFERAVMALEALLDYQRPFVPKPVLRLEPNNET